MSGFKNSEDKIWEEAPRHGILPEGAKDRIWKNIHRATVRKRRPAYTYRALAGVLVMALVTVGGIYLSAHLGKDNIVSVTTDPNDIRLLKLPDGSRIWINEKTEVSYPEQFAHDQRIVHLKGEAFFDIARDTNRPFIIESDGFTTTVLGTSFNIKAYQNAIPKISVISGKVRVTTAHTEKEVPHDRIELTPGEATVYQRASFKKTTFQHREIDWKEVLMDIDNKSLDQVTRRLSGLYKVTFIYRDSIPGNYVLKGSLDVRQPLSSSLEVLSFALEDMDFHQKNDTVWVTDKPKNKPLTTKNDPLMSE